MHQTPSCWVHVQQNSSLCHQHITFLCQQRVLLTDSFAPGHSITCHSQSCSGPPVTPWVSPGGDWHCKLGLCERCQPKAQGHFQLGPQNKGMARLTSPLYSQALSRTWSQVSQPVQDLAESLIPCLQDQTSSKTQRPTPGFPHPPSWMTPQSMLTTCITTKLKISSTSRMFTDNPTSLYNRIDTDLRTTLKTPLQP